MFPTLGSFNKTITTILQVGRGRFFATDKIDDYPGTRVSTGIWSRTGDYQILAKGADSFNSALIAELTLAEFKGRLSQGNATVDYAHYRRAAVKVLFESYEVARGLEKYLRSQGVTPEEKERFARDPNYMNQVRLAVAQGFGLVRAPTPAAEESLSLVLTAQDLPLETFQTAASAVVSAQRVNRLNGFLDMINSHPQMSEAVMNAMLLSLLARKAHHDDPAIRALVAKKMISEGVILRLERQLTDPKDQKLVLEWRQKLYPP